MADSFSDLPNSFGLDRGQIILDKNNRLVAPDEIIKTPTAARALYWKWRTENYERIDLWARLKGLIGGNAPYNQAELDANGLGFIANFNNLDGRSRFKKGALAYWNLLNSTEYLCKFELAGSSPELLGWANIMAKHWTDIIRLWEDFENQTCALTGQLLMFGISPVVWSDEKDWRYKVIELERLCISDQSPTDIRLQTAICFENSYTAQYLYEVYNTLANLTEEGAKNTGWCKEELEKLLLFRANSFLKGDSQKVMNLMEIQNRILNGDLMWDSIFTDEIRLISLLYKEYDGKISHYMFDRDFTSASDFLFKKVGQYDNFNEAVMIFTLSPGEFTIHANKGLAHELYSNCQATMQIDCDIVNMSRLGSTPFIQSMEGLNGFEPIRIIPGVPTNIGSATLVQNTLASNINQLSFAGQYIRRNLDFNIANSGDDPAYPDASQGSISGDEAKMRSFKEFGVLKQNIAHFYVQYDRVVRQVVIRMLKSKKGDPGHEFAEEWISRCIEDGVPPELFETKTPNFLGLPRQIRNVKAARVAGDGSTLARIMGLQFISNIAPSFGAKGIKNYQKETVMAAMGSDYVPAFIGDEEPDETAGGASLATLENALMEMGKEALASPDNEQRSHIVIHMQLGSKIIEARTQQQMGAIDADKIFTVLIPHLEQHIQLIANNPLEVQFFEGVQSGFNQIKQYAILNRKNAAAELQAQIKKQQEDQQATQEVMNEEQRKNIQFQNDERRKEESHASKIQRANEASKSKTEAMKEKIVVDANIQTEKVQQDASIKRMEVALKNEAEKSPQQQLQDMRGSSPAPFDFK